MSAVPDAQLGARIIWTRIPGLGLTPLGGSQGASAPLFSLERGDRCEDSRMENAGPFSGLCCCQESGNVCSSPALGSEPWLGVS